MAMPSQEQEKEQEASSKANRPKAKAGHFFGNKDEKFEHELPKDWKDHVCVRQVKIEMMNGGVVEVPNTSRLQTYTKESFEILLKNKFFSESNFKVVVLHEPK